MGEHPWLKEFPGSIVVCDAQGIILDDEAGSWSWRWRSLPHRRLSSGVKIL
jgi:hypothetical protein